MALIPTMSPYKSLVPCPPHSWISTGTQGKQVCYCENPLMVVTPLRGFCCYHSLRITQLLETGQPHVIILSYLLLLQDAFLDFFLIVWLVHIDPK